jgi:hypothetical protein
MKVELLIKPSQEDMVQIVALREHVWFNEEKLDRATAREIGLIVEDTFDKTAFHYIVRNDGTIVASARLTIHTSIHDVPDTSIYKNFVFHAPSPIGAFSRAVVTKTFQTFSIGGLLNLARYRKAQEIGCSTLIASARPKQAEILSVLGFEVLGRANMLADYSRWATEFELITLVCHLTPLLVPSASTPKMIEKI